MAGGMSRRNGPSLAERALAGVRTPEPPTPPPTPPPSPPPALDDRPRPVLHRHCWVSGLPERPGRFAGLLAEWRQDRGTGGWQGRVVYAVDEGCATVLVESWVPAGHLHPAG